MTDETRGTPPPSTTRASGYPASLPRWVGWLLFWTVVLGISSAFITYNAHQSHLRKVRQCVAAGQLKAATTSVPEIVAECKLDPKTFGS
jgi:hypothetical protein